ncbi:hypothetical protein EON65_01835 [archaeon]|nr:MAG: hypothetical protein EON65_01835 [archaeon]
MSSKRGVHFEEPENSSSDMDSGDEASDSNEGVITTRTEDIVDDLTYDLFNLTACSYHPLIWNSDEDKEQTILALANRASQLLFQRYVSIILTYYS